MSFSGCSGPRSGRRLVPSAKVTWMALAPATTWRAVRMAPWSLTMTPVPSPVSSWSPAGAPALAAWSASMSTSEGRIVWYTLTESGAAFLASAMPLSTSDCTVLAIWAAEGAVGDDEPRVATKTSESTTTATAPPIHGHGQ